MLLNQTLQKRLASAEPLLMNQSWSAMELHI